MVSLAVTTAVAKLHSGAALAQEERYTARKARVHDRRHAGARQSRPAFECERACVVPSKASLGMLPDPTAAALAARAATGAPIATAAGTVTLSSSTGGGAFFTARASQARRDTRPLRTAKCVIRHIRKVSQTARLMPKGSCHVVYSPIVPNKISSPILINSDSIVQTVPFQS